MTKLIMTQVDARTYISAKFNDDAHAMQSGLPTEHVRISFLCEQFNVYHQRKECVFACYADEGETTLIGTYFQNALIDFARY